MTDDEMAACRVRLGLGEDESLRRRRSTLPLVFRR